MRVLGIDPGLNLTGYGCIESPRAAASPALVEAGVFRLKSTADIAHRLEQLFDDLSELLDALRPDVMAVEQLFAAYRHPRTAILMGHARGVVLLCAKQRRIELCEYPATEVKKAVTGNGHAGKLQMQRAVQSFFNLETLPTPSDVADAIGIAYTAMNRNVPDDDDARHARAAAAIPHASS